MSLVSFRDAAKRLGVSTATVRNWAKTGVIKAENGVSPMSVTSGELQRIEDALKSGTIDRLRVRAHKHRASTSRRHTELVALDERSLVEYVGNLLRAYSPSVQQGLVLAAAAIAQARGFRELSAELYHELEHQPSASFIETLVDTLGVASQDSDILGILYQHRVLDGAKALQGAFYTPRKVAQAMADACIKNAACVFDPCSGSGVFLVAAARRFKALGVEDWPRRVYGCDIDPVAAHVTRLSLLLELGEPFAFEPQVVCGDGLRLENLTALPVGEFDVVLSNPPWGAKLSQATVSTNVAAGFASSSEDSFAAFVEIGFQALKTRGLMSYLLPDSVFTTRHHHATRRRLLQHNIREIHLLGHLFPGLLTEVARIDLSKEPQKGSSISVSKHSKNARGALTRFDIPYEVLSEKNGERFCVELDAESSEAIRLIENAPVVYLGTQVEFGLGIVTGNNRGHIRTSPQPSDEPIITGKDIEPFRIGELGRYTTFAPDAFQQCARETLYRAPLKLVYRFIGKRLVVALDDQQRLTLNSANFIVPKPGLSPLLVLAALNARYAQYYYQKKFRALKVLRRHLETLPIPDLKGEALARVEQHAAMLLQNPLSHSDRDDIDALLEDHLGICLNDFEP